MAKSIEDIDPQFSDLDRQLASNDHGDIKVTTNGETIEQSLKNILTTRKKERWGRPNFGESPASLLFDPKDNITIVKIREKIKSAFAQEERANFLSMQAENIEGSPHALRIVINWSSPVLIENQQTALVLEA